MESLLHTLSFPDRVLLPLIYLSFVLSVIVMSRNPKASTRLFLAGWGLIGLLLIWNGVEACHELEHLMRNVYYVWYEPVLIYRTTQHLCVSLVLTSVYIGVLFVKTDYGNKQLLLLCSFFLFLAVILLFQSQLMKLYLWLPPLPRSPPSITAPVDSHGIFFNCAQAILLVIAYLLIAMAIINSMRQQEKFYWLLVYGWFFIGFHWFVTNVSAYSVIGLHRQDPTNFFVGQCLQGYYSHISKHLSVAAVLTSIAVGVSVFKTKEENLRYVALTTLFVLIAIVFYIQVYALCVDILGL